MATNETLFTTLATLRSQHYNCSGGNGATTIATSAAFTTTATTATDTTISQQCNVMQAEEAPPSPVLFGQVALSQSQQSQEEQQLNSQFDDYDDDDNMDITVQADATSSQVEAGVEVMKNTQVHNGEEELSKNHQETAFTEAVELWKLLLNKATVIESSSYNVEQVCAVTSTMVSTSEQFHEQIDKIQQFKSNTQLYRALALNLAMSFAISNHIVLIEREPNFTKKRSSMVKTCNRNHMQSKLGKVIPKEQNNLQRKMQTLYGADFDKVLQLINCKTKKFNSCTVRAKLLGAVLVLYINVFFSLKAKLNPTFPLLSFSFNNVFRLNELPLATLPVTGWFESLEKAAEDHALTSTIDTIANTQRNVIGLTDSQAASLLHLMRTSAISIELVEALLELNNQQQQAQSVTQAPDLTFFQAQETPDCENLIEHECTHNNYATNNVSTSENPQLKEENSSMAVPQLADKSQVVPSNSNDSDDIDLNMEYNEDSITSTMAKCTVQHKADQVLQRKPSPRKRRRIIDDDEEDASATDIKPMDIAISPPESKRTKKTPMQLAGDVNDDII